MAHIPVFADGQDPSKDEPYQFVRRREAAYMIAHGWVKKVPYIRRFHTDALQRLPLVVKSKIRCGQEAVYEAAGIEKYPRFCVGGLTRTEKRPRIIPPFTGARVGHQ